MLVTLSDLKAYLGEATTTYDTFLTEQIGFFSDAIETYCGRKLLSASYVQTFYKQDYNIPQKNLLTYHYPLTAITHVKEDTVAITNYRAHTPTGTLTSDQYFLQCADILEISYTAGFATLPSPIRYAIYGLCEGVYNKRKSGVALNFGSDVQRISIPGTISIDFDYTLTANDRKNAFGNMLGSYLNVIDAYRSERSIGSGTIAYVV